MSLSVDGNEKKQHKNEWLQLIMEAKQVGMTKEQVRDFLKKNTNIQDGALHPQSPVSILSTNAKQKEFTEANRPFL
ncbi:anti-repressor SinI family protein [Bacillus sp. 1P06AnD]|uniref:anti-repressor SinI family protein n=1 Tax=Bacillus sp. 1P06AnD TaxID=3132208 RepID=UPI0039A195E0